MALHRYFKPISGKLPDPNGDLSKEMPSAAIREANKGVEKATEASQNKRSREKYGRFTPTQVAQAAKFAVEHGNQAAIRRYSEEFRMEIKDSTLSTWKSKYCAAIKDCQREGKYAESGEFIVTSLPSKKQGRPLLLGNELDRQVQSYGRATREVKGAVTTTVVLAAGEAVLSHCSKKLSHENGGPVKFTRHWAKSLLERTSFVKQKATTAAKIDPSHFDELKEQYLLDIKLVVEMMKIPCELVFNWDHTGVNIVPGSQWTMEVNGSKWVELASLNDKRQITAVFCASLAGEFLPAQLIYQGKTTACLPRFVFPGTSLILPIIGVMKTR